MLEKNTFEKIDSVLGKDKKSAKPIAPKMIKKTGAKKSIFNTFEYAKCLDLGTLHGKIFLLTVTVCLSYIVQSVINCYQTTSVNSDSASPLSGKSAGDIPTYRTYMRRARNERAKQVNDALEKIGLVPSKNQSQYDLLWAHDYPFDLIDVTAMEPHPRVNYIPGSQALIDKSELAKMDSEFIPKTFQLPNNRYLFLENARQRAGKLYVQRRGRSMILRSPEKIDLKDDGDVSLQEFIDNPLLVDGHKFDLSVYAVVTSIDPLRIYTYKGDAMFRFAPAKYHPFNIKNKDKYFISDSNYLSTWQIPALGTYFNVSGLSMKDSFDAYLKKEGKHAPDLWARVEDAIRTIVLENEPAMLGSINSASTNYFQLIRFDFVIDDTLEPHILGASSSPDYSANHYQRYAKFYEHLTHTVFNLVGISSPYQQKSVQISSKDKNDVRSADKDIVIYAEKCTEPPCSESCASPECELCRNCLNTLDADSLHAAYREHINIGETRRIFPLPIHNYELDEEFLEELSPKNQMMYKWFLGKCLRDHLWC